MQPIRVRVNKGDALAVSTAAVVSSDGFLVCEVLGVFKDRD
jgi:hypothetical protein